MNEAIEKSFTGFFEICKANIPEKDHPKILEAFNLAVEVFGERKKKTGEFILTHAISVARIVVQEIGQGVDTAIAALLHNRPADPVARD